MNRKNNKNKTGYAIAAVFFILALLVILVLICLLPFLRAREETPSTEPPTETVLPLNRRQEEDFTEIGGRICYPGAVAGIDVSEHQGEIDWNAVSEDGIRFAYVRLGRRGPTEGKLFTDDCYKQNIDGASAAGLDVGVYFYSQAVSAEEAAEEAEFVIRALEGRQLTLPIFFDWERGSRPDRVKSIALRDVTGFALAFCETVEKAGYRAGVYFNQRDGYSMELKKLKDYSFWLAEYAGVMDYYYDVDCWQYGTGTVAGVSTAVDMNLMFGESNE